jgi:hypothetical protein
LRSKKGLCQARGLSNLPVLAKKETCLRLSKNTDFGLFRPTTTVILRGAT